MEGLRKAAPRHDHDIDQNQATFSIAKGREEPGPFMGADINPKMNEAALLASQGRPHPIPASFIEKFASASHPIGAIFSTLESEAYQVISKEEAMEPNLVRCMSPAGSRSGSDSSRRRSISSTNSSQAPLIRPSFASREAEYESRGPVKSTLFAPLPPTTNIMDSRERRKLLRSTRKLSKILGETPVLSTTIGASEVNLDMIDASVTMMPLGWTTATFNGKGIGYPKKLSKGGLGLTIRNNYPSSPPAYEAARTRTHSSPLTPRNLPILKVDCSCIAPSSKRSRHGSSPILDGDALSFISTTTTTTTLERLSPSVQRRSPLSPTSTISGATTDGDRDSYVWRSKAKEVRRTKLAKLMRHLGENVPTELVFPKEDIPRSSSSSSSTLKEDAQNASVEVWSAKVASDIAIEERQGAVVPPPRRGSLTKRKKRVSLHLDFSRRKGMLPLALPATIIEDETPKIDKRDGISRSHSLRDRKEQQDSPMKSTSSLDAVRYPLSDRQKALNVRRAMKMTQVFGDAPSKALIQTTNVCAQETDDAITITSKRHSFHSLASTISTSTMSSRTRSRSRAASDSSIRSFVDVPLASEMQREAEIAARAANSTFITSNTSVQDQEHSAEVFKGLHRRPSLSKIPGTPPPFARYFQPSTPPLHLSGAESGTPPSTAPPRTPSSAEPHSPVSPINSPKRLQRRGVHRHSPSLPSGLSGSYLPGAPTNESSPTLSPRSPNHRRAGTDPLPLSGTGLDANAASGETFRARRLRAAKLARFFGVGYNDLFPADSDVGTAASSEPDLLLSPAKSPLEGRSPFSPRSDFDGHGHKRGQSETDMRALFEGVSVTVVQDVRVDVSAGGDLAGEGPAVGGSVELSRRPSGRRLDIESGKEVRAPSRLSMAGARVEVDGTEADMRDIMGRLRELR